VKHRKVDLEQIKRDKEALEVKMGEDACEEDTKTRVGSGDELVKVWSVSVRGRRLRRWLDTRVMFIRSLQSCPYCFWKYGRVGEGVVCVCEEGGCVAGWRHTGCVWSVAFSPDGQHIVSGSGDELVKVWSVSEGGCII
jgi:WD40 repeat protein